MTIYLVNKDEIRRNLIEAVQDLEACQKATEGAAGSFLEAAGAQQAARNLQKSNEAAIIAANPSGIFTPRASSPEIKEAYLREQLKDIDHARAMAEDALVSATYEQTLATTRRETALSKVAALTAVLNSL